MDALSEVLSAVQMHGAIFFDVVCRAPWGFVVPSIDEAAPLLSPGSERLVAYHLVCEGEALIRLEDGEELLVRAGDVVVLPRGAPHDVSRGSPATFADNRSALGEAFSGRPRTLEIGGGGETTRIACGFFACERSADRLFLAGLPPIFRVPIREQPAGAWIESSIRHLVSEAASGRPGTAALLSKMAEALFVETLRGYLDRLPPEQRGWLAGARDPIVGAALRLLHADPGRSWTVDDLASEVGSSRSVVGERFSSFLGEPPLTYLTRWRLQLAARQLAMTHKTVVEIANDVGYRSEAAFNRAFKREMGLPPAQYRKTRRASS
jgi:AraC-like DNA-binding protein